LKDREPTKRELYRDKVKQKIRQFFHESIGTYGAPRILEDLIEAGYSVSEKTVGRYMREMGLRATPLWKYVSTTDSSHSLGVYPNLLDRNFNVDEPNKVWTGDITYIWTREGWLYLAMVLDLYSRLVVGWSIADNMRTELPLEALDMAINLRKPEEGLVHHSDQGSQYASKEYVTRLNEIKATISMSHKGTPYDNATSESFFATLKKELIYRRDFKTRAEAIKAVTWYIAAFYNKRRRHSYNAYLSPEKFEIQEQIKAAKQNEQAMRKVI
ncbi:IS3 family transposase, partial [Alkalibacterium sp. 20]|uniref:IS3 family transposase n=1 Tax=Alkalibacterium sp. 20 TaxID=1798803 RepID=UPI000911E441